LKQVDYNGSFTYSNIIEVNVTTPSQFELSQNYPNPFNPTTKINYAVPFDSKVTISVYSITGELVAELVNNFVTAGSHSVNFDASNLSSGMYIYKMTAGSFTQSNKMLLLK
ncbi:MAG: T9SS type A sorting domain-containing protein, partial [Ignavibacterium sp.]